MKSLMFIGHHLKIGLNLVDFSISYQTYIPDTVFNKMTSSMLLKSLRLFQTDTVDS